MIQNIKYTVFDIDGTLVPGDSVISKAMLQTLQQLIDKGFVVGFATGRNFTFASELTDLLNGEFYLAAYNGSVIFKYPEKIIIQESFLTNHDTESVRKVLAERSHPCIVNATIHDQENAYTFTQPAVRPPILNFLENQRKKYGVLENLYQTYETKFSCLYAAVPSDIVQQEVSILQKEFPLFNFTYIKDPNSEGFHWLGLMPQNTNKKCLLLYFQEKHGAQKKEILAAGDDMNDLGMLQEAGLSIAMGSAPQAVKDTASTIIGTAQEESLREFLKPLLQIK